MTHFYLFGEKCNCANALKWFRKIILHRPGIEPGTPAWKAAMLTITPSTLVHLQYRLMSHNSKDIMSHNSKYLYSVLWPNDDFSPYILCNIIVINQMQVLN